LSVGEPTHPPLSCVTYSWWHEGGCRS